MSVEVQTIRGPLDDEQLTWLTGLYGPVDPKYGSLEFVRHQFVDNDFGWAVHAFAMDDGTPVAHTGVVPFRARRGTRPLTAGKIEAVVVAESHRGQRTERGGSIATETLQAAYQSAHDNGIEVLFGLAPPRVTAIHVRAGCRRVPVQAETYILFTTPTLAARDWARRQRLAAFLLSAAQRALVGAAYTATRIASLGRTRVRVGPLSPLDIELASANADPDEWTISGADAWSWYAGSGLLAAVEIGGPFGSRALIRLGARETAIQIVAWRARGGSLLNAILLLGAVARIARRHRAPTLRFQPWAGSGGDGRLARACKILGFVRRTETELILHGDVSALEAELRLTPFFYVTF